MIEKLITEMLQDFVTQTATDVYFMPQDSDFEIKILAQNNLKIYRRIPQNFGIQIINYLKFRAGLMLSEHRRPQTGSLVFDGLQASNHKVFGRISTVGDFQGKESMVIRLIYQLPLMQDSFFFENQYQFLKQQLQSKGLILFCGPVSSGKTTTMYQLANLCRQQQVMTIEDPVEIYEPTFLQLQVNEKAGMTYLNLLKAALRHHPDLLIIGEIRDQATAQAVFDAALSGHLVFTTIHADCAASALRRLLDWQIPAADVAAAVRVVNYQRLLPTIDQSFKVLCEQMVVDQTSLTTLSSSSISAEWGQQLNECFQNNWISLSTKKAFTAG